PEIALRVYDFGDPRSFFLYWDTCSVNTPCTAHPTGSWQTTSLTLSQLRIQAAGANTPPASLDAIDPNAPIKELQLRSSYGFGQPWHGWVDNPALSFGGSAAIVYNFEINTVVITSDIHDVTHGIVTSVSAGAAVHDHVGVSGGGPMPTGTVTLKWFANNTCSAG